MSCARVCVCFLHACAAVDIYVYIYIYQNRGPPYALLQGSLKSAAAASLKVPDAEKEEGAHPPLARGHVAWAGEEGGPDFFICTAEHPEWGLGHSVFAEVLPTDMRIVDAVVTHPLKLEDWSGVNVTVLVDPVPFVLLRP